MTSSRLVSRMSKRRKVAGGPVVLLKPRDRKLLVTLRVGSHLTQRAAADILGISCGHMADIERGYRKPSLALGERIADLYGLDLATLFDEVPMMFGAVRSGS